MNEVEKMYRNVLGYVCNMPDVDCFHECEKCDSYITFTAEKQLLLIQWLAKTRPIHISFLLDKWTIEGMVRYGIKYDTFEDALSGYINQIWQSLTEEERTQIKEILE